MKQDESIGQITKEDLEEGLRVNRHLLWRQIGIRDCWKKMVERSEGIIAREQKMIEEIIKEKDEAPEKIEKIEKKIREQEEQLREMGVRIKREKEEKTTSHQKKLLEFTGRIARGDMKAVVELQEYLRNQKRG